MPRPGVRLDRLVDALEVVTGLLGGGPFTYEGEHHRAADAMSHPGPRTSSRGRRVFVGGKGDRLLRIAARHADGWNTCWVWTPDAYRGAAARLRRRVRGRRSRSRDDVAHARPLRAVRRERTRSRTPLRAVARAVTAGRARRCRPRELPHRSPRRHRRRGPRRRCASGRRSASTRSSSASARCRSRSRRPTTSRSSSAAPRRRAEPVDGQLGGDEISSRRRRRIRRRSRSDAPPQTPCSMRLHRARTRGTRACTGQSTQMCWADSTPSPSDGKNSAGWRPGNALSASTRIPRGSRPRLPPLHRSLTARRHCWFDGAPGFARAVRLSVRRPIRPVTNLRRTGGPEGSRFRVAFGENPERDAVVDESPDSSRPARMDVRGSTARSPSPALP